jgi:hypothetical protein
MNHYRVDLSNGMVLGVIADNWKEAKEIILHNQGEYIHSLIVRIRKIPVHRYMRIFYNIG